MAEPFPRASPGVPPVAMALRLGAGPAKAAPTLRSARSIFPAAHVAGKNDPDSFRLAPETRKGVPLPGPFPGGRGTGVPGQLPASVGSTCNPPGREATSAAGAFGAVSLRLPCVKGAGARRATEGLSAETFAERIIPVRPFYPLLSRWVRELKFVPPNAFLPPFRGHLPGGGKAPSSNLPGCSRHGTPSFRPCRRLEMQYGKHHDKRTGSGADPGHRQE